MHRFTQQWYSKEKKYNFTITPKSFFQTNTSGAEKLYECVQDMIQYGDGVMLDLYAGTGTLGIICSDKADHVYSVELVESASEDNIYNRDKNSLTNITPINMKVEDFAKQYKEKLQESSIHTIIIDPPRSGMHPDAPKNILRFDAKEIIYVSCNPSTLTRDLEHFI